MSRKIKHPAVWIILAALVMVSVAAYSVHKEEDGIRANIEELEHSGERFREALGYR